MKDLVYRLRDFVNEDLEEVFKIYSSNKAYFMLSGGSPATKEDIYNDLNESPPNSQPTNKHYQVITLHDEIIGVIDFVEHYPDVDSVYLGLLLIEQNLQGLGHGHKIMEDFQVNIKERGYERIRLGVLNNHPSALKFWRQLGYQFIKEVDSTIHPERNWTLFVMEKDISSL